MTPNPPSPATETANDSAEIRLVVALLEQSAKSLFIACPRLVGYGVVLVWQNPQPADPPALVVANSPDGNLSPEIAARLLANVATLAGDLVAAVKRTAQEIDHEFAARTREAQVLAEARKGAEPQDERPADPPTT